jgi:hypothetical protein
MLARALPCSALNASGSATRTAAVAPRRSPSPHRPTSPNPNDHAFATFRKREKRGGDRKRGGRREEGRVGGGRGKQAPRIHEAARVGIRRWRRWSCVCLSVGSGGELNDDGKATQLFLMEEPTERTGPFPPLARLVRVPHLARPTTGLGVTRILRTWTPLTGPRRASWGVVDCLLVVLRIGEDYLYASK